MQDRAESDPKKFTLIAGIHSVQSVVHNTPNKIKSIWFDRARNDRRLQDLIKLAHQANIPFQLQDRVAINQAAPDIQNQGVLAWVSATPTWTKQDFFNLLNKLNKPPLLLILDSIQDPHNLGACLRTAEAAGVDAVIAPKNNAVGLTSVVSKVASGAAEKLPYIQVSNLVRIMQELKKHGVWLFGTAPDATQDIYTAQLTGPLGLVMGGEGDGLRRLTRENCDFLLRIPIYGQVASLNVSVATGICLYEALRQRNH